MERPADVENGYSLTAPLVYHFGHKSPDANPQLYNLLVSQLAEIINMRSEANNKSTFVLLHSAGCWTMTGCEQRLIGFRNCDQGRSQGLGGSIQTLLKHVLPQRKPNQFS